MSYTSTLTLNDTTASVKMPSIKSTDSKVEWSLSMTSGSNTASTMFSTPITRDYIATTDNDYNEKTKHVAFIKETLEAIDKTKGRDIKASYAQMLFNYMAGPGLEFVKVNERFKLAVIKKCYELKLCIPESDDLVKSIDNVLTSLNMPLEKPSDLIITTTSTCTNSNCTIHPKATNVNTDTILNFALFTAMAKQWSSDMKNIDLHFTHCEAAIKRGSLTGSTIAEKMKTYFDCWNTGAYSNRRTNLMKNLFTKNQLVFSDIVMPLYDEWKKSYKPVGKSNRYITMTVFIDTHKSLFSTI